MKRVRVLAWASVALLLVSIGQASVHANFFGLHPNGATGCAQFVANIGYQADNGHHSFRYEYLSSSMQGPTTWARNHAVEPHLTTSMDPTPDSNTDVWVTDSHYTSLCGVNWFQGPADTNGGAVGLAICERTTVAGRCHQHKVRYNNHFTDYVGGTGMRRDLACHEIGHSMGLKHRPYDPDTPNSRGCMPLDYPKPVPKYSPHDQGHLATY